MRARLPLHVKNRFRQKGIHTAEQLLQRHPLDILEVHLFSPSICIMSNASARFRSLSRFLALVTALVLHFFFPGHHIYPPSLLAFSYTRSLTCIR